MCLVQRKMLRRLAAVALTLSFFAAIGLCWVQLGRSLKRVEFKFDSWGVVLHDPSMDFGTDDPEFLANVEVWRRGLKRWETMAALRQAGGRIVLRYRNGTSIEFLTHALGPNGPGSVVLLNGQHMFSEQEPFSDFLRKKLIEWHERGE